jgi:hypothetical protein
MYNNSWRKLNLLLKVLFILLICISCATFKKHWKGPYLEHIVKWPGETVSIIAGWYTGDIENWEAVADANPNLNKNLIMPGDKVHIPEYLLKNREPMPKHFVESFYPEAEKQIVPEEPSPPSIEEEEPELFGPK